MRRDEPGAHIDHAQSSAADQGIKGMIPIGRPFLEYVISALADAGFQEICLVIGPQHQRIREYFEREVRPTRVRLHFAVQKQPLGTANAVLAAEKFAAGEHVIVLNSDNYYPVHTLRALRELGAAGVAAFERETLIRESNIPAERAAKYAIIEMNEQGLIKRIIEKPDAATYAALHGEILIGMNSWSLPPEIYDACRSIEPSARGEVELPNAVQYAVAQLGVPFHVLIFHEGVLDLSSRGDIAAVAERLRGVEPQL